MNCKNVNKQLHGSLFQENETVCLFHIIPPNRYGQLSDTGPLFTEKTPYYGYRNSHYKTKTVWRPSQIYYKDPYTNKTVSLWVEAQCRCHGGCSIVIYWPWQMPCIGQLLWNAQDLSGWVCTTRIYMVAYIPRVMPLILLCSDLVVDNCNHVLQVSLAVSYWSRNASGNAKQKHAILFYRIKFAIFHSYAKLTRDLFIKRVYKTLRKLRCCGQYFTFLSCLSRW